MTNNRPWDKVCSLRLVTLPSTLSSAVNASFFTSTPCLASLNNLSLYPLQQHYKKHSVALHYAGFFISKLSNFLTCTQFWVLFLTFLKTFNNFGSMAEWSSRYSFLSQLKCTAPRVRTRWEQSFTFTEFVSLFLFFWLYFYFCFWYIAMFGLVPILVLQSQ